MSEETKKTEEKKTEEKKTETKSQKNADGKKNFSDAELIQQLREQANRSYMESLKDEAVHFVTHTLPVIVATAAVGYGVYKGYEMITEEKAENAA